MASTTKGDIRNKLRRTHARDMDDLADSIVTLTDTQTFQVLTPLVVLIHIVTLLQLQMTKDYK